MRRITASIALLAFAAHASAATSVKQDGAQWRIENAQIRVLVEPASGAVSVFDKAAGYTWRQPPTGRAAPKQAVIVRRGAPPANAEWVLSKGARKPDIVIAHTMIADARKVDSAADCRARVWCSWDAQSLYVTVAVDDDVLNFGDAGLKRWWTRDSIELWVGGRQIGLHLAAGAPQFRTATAALEGGSLALAPCPGGYAVRASLPWSMLGRRAAKLGDRFPFAIGVNDADAGDREGQIYFPATWKHSTPDTFAQAALADEQGVAPAPKPASTDVYRHVKPLRNPAGLAVETVVNARGRKLPLLLEFTVPDAAPELVVDVDMPDRKRNHPYFVAFPPLALDTPDAALAVADYCNGHLYPLDMDPFPRWFMTGNRLDMPWAAIVDGPAGRGYMLLIETSDDCGLRMRKCAMPARGTLAPAVEWWASFRSFRYPRRMRYSFFAKGGYVAAAKRYRAYAKKLGLVKPFAEKVRKTPNIQRLFGAPDVWGDASLDFARQAKALGVDKMLIHGKTAAKHMAAINELGYLTSTYDNYTDILPLDEKHPDIDRNRAPLPDHAVLKADGKRMKAWLSFDKKTQYMKRCPTRWVPAASLVIPRELREYPYLGRFIDVTTAESLYECFDPQHPLTRTQKRACGVALESYVRSLGLVVGGEHGIWWGVPHMDYIEGMMSGGNYSWPAGHLRHPKSKDQEWTNPWGRKLPPFERYEKLGIGHEYRVPLWELVFHDCIVSTWYWGDASDWLLDAAPEVTPKKDAFNVLYGTIPLLWANAGGSWVKDRDAFLTTYRNTCKLHEQIAGEEMLSHEFVTADRAVQRTVFSSGTECVVNFGADPREVQVKGHVFVLPQNGFAVVGPKVRQSLQWVEGKRVTTVQTPGYWRSDAGGVAVSMRAAGDGRLAIQAGPCAHAVALRPERVAAAWDLSSTRVYELAEDGERFRAVRHRVQDAALKVGPFLASTRLEALCGDAALAPDLAIVACRRGDGSPRALPQGADAEFVVRVRNFGFAPAQGRVDVYADQAQPAMRLASRRIAAGPDSAQDVRIAAPTARLDGARTLIFVATLGEGRKDLCPRNDTAAAPILVEPNWSQWPARVDIVASAGPVEREDAAVVMPVDFGPILAQRGLKGPLDLDALRVAERDAAGKLKGLVPAQFDPAEGAKGELCWIMPGRTPAGASRRFCALLRTGRASLLPHLGSAWRPREGRVDAPGYTAKFTNGVLTSLAPKRNGQPGPDFLRNLILSSAATGWSREEDSTVERFEAAHVGPVRTVVIVKKKLKAGVEYEKTYAFYPDRIDLSIVANKQAGGLLSRAHYKLLGTYVDDKGITAQVDGNGEENRSTYGKNKNPRWYAMLGQGWAHSCIALGQYDHLAYWDGGYMGAIGFVGPKAKPALMSYVVHGEQPDASFAERDWQRLTQPVQARVVND